MTQKTLILAEKPSVGRDFAEALSKNVQKGDGYLETDQFVITWAIGHLLTPYDPDDYDKTLKKWTVESLPIIPTEFKYKSIKESKKQLDVIKKLFKRDDITRLIVATDAGREGELIARLILKEVKNKLPALRFFTSDALTKEVIIDGIKKSKPLKDYDRLFLAGLSRQKADWLVGMNLSRIVTIKMGDLFSVGRVQTAVLDLIVERRDEIDHFKPKQYFELKANFKFANDSIDTYWFDPSKKVDEKRRDKKADFEKIISAIEKDKAIISKREEVERTHYPDGLYSLTELQRRANSEFGFSAQKTLDIAQSLYEKYKVLSYPRTDSKVMGTSSLDLISEKVNYFKNEYPEKFSKFAPYKVSLKNKALFDDSKLTDHHGLIPLKKFNGPKDSPEGKIYQLVLNKFIANFLENHRFLEVDFEVTCAGEKFKAKARKVLEMGFKILEEKIKDDEIKNLNQGDSGKLNKAEIESKETKPPFEYTEASLLYDMTNPARLVDEEKLKKIFRTEVGLGTQATRANIIETLIKRGYVKRSGKNLIAVEKGITLIKKLKALDINSQIASAKETAKWELSLGEMASGETNDETFLDSICDFVTESIIEWKKEASLPKQNTYAKKFEKFTAKEIGSCPVCQKKVMNYPKSYGCEGWKDGCKFTIWKVISGAKISEKEAQHIMKNKKSHLIKSFKSKAGKPFSAYLVMNSTGKIEFQFENNFATSEHRGEA